MRGSHPGRGPHPSDRHGRATHRGRAGSSAGAGDLGPARACGPGGPPEPRLARPAGAFGPGLGRSGVNRFVGYLTKERTRPGVGRCPLARSGSRCGDGSGTSRIAPWPRTTWRRSPTSPGGCGSDRDLPQRARARGAAGTHVRTSDRLSVDQATGSSDEQLDDRQLGIGDGHPSVVVAKQPVLVELWSGGTMVGGRRQGHRHGSSFCASPIGGRPALDGGGASSRAGTGQTDVLDGAAERPGSPCRRPRRGRA